MSKTIKRKFYRPGTLEVPGTKITLKTQPYTNGVLFDITDPITSFRAHLIVLKALVSEYSKLINIPGIDTYIPKNEQITSEGIAQIILLLNYLIESPIEMVIKDQQINEDIIASACNAAIRDLMPGDGCSDGE